MSALIISDRVVETTTTTGTGDLTLAGAVAGYQRFSAKMSVGDTAYCTVEAINGSGLATGDWETGLYTYSAANTLTRTSVKDSSNSGSAVSFAAGTKRVFLNMIADQIIARSRWSVVEDFTISSAIANHDVNVSAYDDVICQIMDVTTSSSGSRAVQLSVDGGSTFYSTSGDYQFFTAAGVKTAGANLTAHATASASARGGKIKLYGLRQSSAPKTCDSSDLTDLGTYLFVGSNSAITHVRYLNSAGNMTAGRLITYGK